MHSHCPLLSSFWPLQVSAARLAADRQRSLVAAGCCGFDPWHLELESRWKDDGVLELQSVHQYGPGVCI